VAADDDDGGRPSSARGADAGEHSENTDDPPAKQLRAGGG